MKEKGGSAETQAHVPTWFPADRLALLVPPGRTVVEQKCGVRKATGPILTLSGWA